MIIYPAIDLRGGRVVRLKEGDPNRQITFSDNPLETARSWMEQGASWIHMVNLDGAFAEANDNGAILEQVAALGVKVQFGGGLRKVEDIAQALEHGATRVVLGTLAVEQPEIIPQLVEQWGADAICIALDARDGKIATRGWKEKTDHTPVSFGQEIAQMGAKHALYTDVSRDGQLSGANIDDTVKLGRETGLRVIASGGVTTIDEIQQLERSGMVAGAVIGMALYEGKITLQEAIAAGGNRAQ
ncbi:MAG: 1-(5-phosphoribosyl)-5-[(5-phosphoribosylamino)methylideneamino]imidazole-4-carboxamide isomerase [Anaerolineae bacterium]|nr:1-(5-phosphoribosyl)-5-[(5-phosphoribosylamino)methylideneamino]imidazole-4-carboxamide isomerase [Anaerolineae bacterium]